MCCRLPLQFSLLLLLLGIGYIACCHSTRYRQISPEIVRELKDFVDLIPAARVDEIIAEHYLLDGGFRKAIEYVRSTQFSKMLDHLQELPEIIEILDFLHLRVGQQLPEQRKPRCTTSDFLRLWLASIDGIRTPTLDIVLLDEDELVLQHLEAYDLRTFTSFVEELMRYLPRGQYLQLINEKRQKSAAFAAFYTALRGVNLQSMVEAVMEKPNVAEVIKTLLAKSVDVHSLQPVIFKVISWGPDV